MASARVPYFCCANAQDDREAIEMDAANSPRTDLARRGKPRGPGSYARYVGRVGALAVALGAGAAIASVSPVAFADTNGSPGSHGSVSSGPSGGSSSSKGSSPGGAQSGGASTSRGPSTKSGPGAGGTGTTGTKPVGAPSDSDRRNPSDTGIDTGAVTDDGVPSGAAGARRHRGPGGSTPNDAGDTPRSRITTGHTGFGTFDRSGAEDHGHARGRHRQSAGCRGAHDVYGGLGGFVARVELARRRGHADTVRVTRQGGPECCDRPGGWAVVVARFGRPGRR